MKPLRSKTADRRLENIEVIRIYPLRPPTCSQHGGFGGDQLTDDLLGEAGSGCDDVNSGHSRTVPEEVVVK